MRRRVYALAAVPVVAAGVAGARSPYLWSVLGGACRWAQAFRLLRQPRVESEMDPVG